MELRIEWDEFIEEIDLLCNDGNLLLESTPRSNNEYEIFTSDYNAWREKIIVFFKKSLGNDNQFVREFKYANKNNFQFQQHKSNPPINVRDLKKGLRNDIIFINYYKNILKVSDLIIRPSQVDSSLRENYSSEDILELILEKLYILYDDNMYAILPILEGNGIKLKKKREEFDYVKILEDSGLVKSNKIGNVADAQLTMAGKLYVEEKRKKIKPNYQSISDDEKTIVSQFDELFRKLEELGFGQQIIFDELEELRGLYKTLNKKNWGELAKGKIIDLGLSTVINKDQMKLIYEYIINDILYLP